ncbi:universal stress protein [Algoriphagus sanaruensis]|uniref:Universal stress protein n=1 Tax=Algoriphagus sanaruensis TaxID=1727163 RepID=A0A142EP09_9BACT|nr:universal stress protein [Algoriphagus sanaruensis]
MMNHVFTILCPTDFSECSLNAIEYASRLGEKYQARLVLFHVLNREDYLKISPLDSEGTYQKQFVEEKLKSLQNTVHEECLLNGLQQCSFEIREGKIVKETLEYAKEIQADLIVMGTEGMNDLRINYVGSRTSSLVERSDIDVLIIPRKVYFKAPRKLVYATDYLEEDKLAIQKVIEFAEKFDSEVDMIHISQTHKALDKSLHMTVVEEMKPFIRYDKVNFVLKSYRDELALGLENYLLLSKGDILVTLSRKKDYFDQIFSKNLSKKMSYFLSKPLWVIKTL